MLMIWPSTFSEDKDEKDNSLIGYLNIVIYLIKYIHVSDINLTFLAFIFQLFQEGKLTGTKVAHLKAKYTELHELLKG